MATSTPEKSASGEQDGKSSADYDALLAQAREERGDPLQSEWDYKETGRSDDVVRDEYRAYGAKPHVEAGMKLEEQTAKERSLDEGDAASSIHSSDARHLDERAAEAFHDARRGVEAAADAYDNRQTADERAKKLIEDAQEQLDKATDPDRTV